MTSDKDQHDLLDGHFSALRGKIDPPDEDLVARVLTDAEREQQTFHSRAPLSRSERRTPFQGLLAAIGGWPAAAGLVTAGLTGVWIGVYPPALVVQTSQAILPASDVDYVVDLDLSSSFAGFEGGL